MNAPVLIPAAGKSERMGRPKLLLPLAGRPVLEHLLEAVRGGGAGPALVVVRPDDTALAETARRCGATVLTLAHETPDMRATIQAGLVWLEAHLTPADRPGFFLVPADHPTLSGDVVRALLAAAVQSGHSIVLPVHGGKRGHPTWIAWSHVPALLQLPAGTGVNAYLRQQASHTLEVPWPDAAVLLDLDTPEDYDRLVRGA